MRVSLEYTHYKVNFVVIQLYLVAKVPTIHEKYFYYSLICFHKDWKLVIPLIDS